MSRASPGLARLERWMLAVVTHPAGVEAGARGAAASSLLPQAARNLESMVLASKSLSASDRLGIYAHAYYARLIEVMTEEYPTTRRILGPETFERACRRYIDLHPSTERTLQHLTVEFPAFLSRHLPTGPRRALGVDVARIERAMEDVFDAPQAEPLRHSELAAIAPNDWQRLRLRLNPALVLLALRTPANEYMNAARGGGRALVPAPRPSYVVVHRHNYRVLRETVDSAQFALLSALHDGKPLGTAVALALRRCRGGPAQQGTRLRRWFRDWTAAGMFCSAERLT